MNTFILSLCIGLAAALLDIIPMVLKKLDNLFILSAFSLWVIIGIVNAQLQISRIPLLNGLIIALLFFIPLSFLIYRQDPGAFLQVCLSTLILGSLLGLTSGFLLK